MTETGPRPRWIRRVGVLAIILAAVSAPFWYRAALGRLDFFRVRRVEVVGARYANPDEIVSRMGVDSTASIWDDAGPLEARVRRLPSVRDVHVGRRLPGTLVVHVTENMPVALVPGASGLVAVDAAGQTLRIDPTAVDVDLPVLRGRDALALRLLGEIRGQLPAVFARIGDVRRAPDGSIAIHFTEPAARVVLALPDLTMDRLFDIIPVEADLARRHVGAAEIDLRYRDQVVARLP
ncbi:MAG TPA: FtsQ-type POTRA domain-containing protein [Gemmatimonadaceae bacterium]|nr:FtsQ-type POTRA domain-containing protein [Gemmatimonadaceae bacterium]